jgi:hypothetical protein
MCGIFAYLNFLTPKTRQEILELLINGKLFAFIYKKIQMGSVAKSYEYMRKGFLIYEEIRKYLARHEGAVSQI